MRGGNYSCNSLFINTAYKAKDMLSKKVNIILQTF